MRAVFAGIGLGIALAASMAAIGVDRVAAQGTFTVERVHFARGAHSATIQGKVSRDEAQSYVVGARAGQTMTISLEGDAKTSFDLSGPKDKSGQAMASSETEWTGTLPDNGDYKIFVITWDQVKAPFALTISIE